MNDTEDAHFEFSARDSDQFGKRMFISKAMQMDENIPETPQNQVGVMAQDVELVGGPSMTSTSQDDFDDVDKT